MPSDSRAKICLAVDREYVIRIPYGIRSMYFRFDS